MKRNTFLDLIKNTDFDFKIEELKDVNFSKLNEFFEEFVASTEEERSNILKTLKVSQEIRAYEDMIFEKYRNQDISLRVKGRLKFTDLTEQEQASYIKHDIRSYDALLKAFETHKNELTPRIANVMVQRITQFYLVTKPAAEDYDIKMLNLFKDYRYKSILKKVTNNFDQLSNLQFVLFCWSVGKLHQKEMGIVNFDFFEIMKQRIIEQVSVCVCVEIGGINVFEIVLTNEKYQGNIFTSEF